MTRIFNILLVASFLGCQSCERPKITKADLEKSEFVYCNTNHLEQAIKWKNFSKNEQTLILNWIACSTNKLEISLITYVPNIIIQGEKYRVNFTDDKVVYNYQTSAGKWKQGARERTADDDKVVNCIIDKIKNRMRKRRHFCP